jgi:hypothetical protein
MTLLYFDYSYLKYIEILTLKWVFIWANFGSRMKQNLVLYYEILFWIQYRGTVLLLNIYNLKLLCLGWKFVKYILVAKKHQCTMCQTGIRKSLYLKLRICKAPESAPFSFIIDTKVTMLYCCFKTNNGM